jgi:heat-inducible transcriptional repressor
MLDERKSAILRAVVEEYISRGEPVGSSHLTDALARVGASKVSSATIRNEMAALERDGYLMQPHTSAGRIPTDRGYRFYVDQLQHDESGEPRSGAVLPRSLETKVGQFFESAHGRLEETLHRTSTLLAQLTNYASVVLGPGAGTVLVRSVQLVRLAGSHVAVVVVLSTGAVENATIEVADDVTDDELARAAAHLSSTLVGATRAAAGSSASQRAAAPGALTDTIARVAEQAMGALREAPGAETYFVDGTSRLTEAFDAIEVVRDVLRTLEQQYVVVTLVRDMLRRGQSVAIGAEHGVEPLASCSLVLSPVVADGRHVGTVGVIGPTRMHYPTALATVEVVGSQLARRLADS